MKINTTQLKDIIRQTLVEQEEGEQGEGRAGGGVGNDLWSEKYEAFVTKIGQNAKDPKTIAFLGAGKLDNDPDDDAFDFKEGGIPVAKLRPTQSEVDIDKSLVYPLDKNPKGFIDFVTLAGNPYTLGAPIITFNGKYVIDGHHRWSQVYACNDKASIMAIDISLNTIVDPMDALKAVQAAIAVQAGKVPQQHVKGSNLFKMGEADILKWVQGNVTGAVYKLLDQSSEASAIVFGGHEPAPNLDEVFGLSSQDKMDKELEDQAATEDPKKVKGLASYIWKNVATLQKKSPPVKGATVRGYMPQTDDVNWKPPLAKGEIDIASPHASLQEKKTYERWQQIAKIIKG